MLKIIDICPQLNEGPRTPQGWRSWLNDLTHWQHDLLHNHRPEGGEIYRIPLVQFHSRGFRGMQQGAALLRQLLPLLEAEANLSLSTTSHELRMLDSPQTYRLHRWQPFNPANFAEWLARPGLADRIGFLEGLLTGHLLGFCRAVDYMVPNKSLTVRLVDSLGTLGYQKFRTQNADLRRLTFSISFEANLDLPSGIGLGKGVSKGFGAVQKVAETEKVPTKRQTTG